MDSAFNLSSFWEACCMAAGVRRTSGWGAVGLLNSVLPELALFCRSKSLRVTLSQASYCPESVCRLLYFPKMASGHTLSQPPEHPWKQLVFLCGDHITCSCSVTVSLSCSLCPFDLLKMSFSILLMNMKLNLGSRAGEAGAGAGMCCLRPWLGCIPVTERQLWPMAFGEVASGRDWLMSASRAPSPRGAGAAHQAAFWRLAAEPEREGRSWEGFGETLSPALPSVDNAPASLFFIWWVSDETNSPWQSQVCFR